MKRNRRGKLKFCGKIKGSQDARGLEGQTCPTALEGGERIRPAILTVGMGTMYSALVSALFMVSNIHMIGVLNRRQRNDSGQVLTLRSAVFSFIAHLQFGPRLRALSDGFGAGEFAAEGFGKLGNNRVSIASLEFSEKWAVFGRN